MWIPISRLAMSLAWAAPSADTSIPPRLTEHRIPVAAAETLAVSSAGAGPVILFLSGPIGSSYTWRHVTPVLVDAGFRVLLVDPLGMGSSDRPRGADYTLEAQAERVRAVLDSAGVASVVVVTHGMSSSIAMRLALAHPGRIAALVSLEGGFAERAGSPGVKRALALAPLLRLFGGRRIIRGKIRGGLTEASGDPSWVTEAVVDRYAEGPARDVGATLSVLGAMADAREPLALEPRLGRLALPVIVLTGAAPHKGGPGNHELAVMRDSIPSAEFVEVEGAGHYLQEERPNIVTAAVSRAIARVRLALAGS